MAFKKGETCLDEVTIKIFTEYDEDDASISQIRVEITHDGMQDKETFIFPDMTQIQELDLDTKIQEYYDNHWDGGASWMKEYDR